MMIGTGSCGLFAAAELLTADANAETSWNPARLNGDSHHWNRKMFGRIFLRIVRKGACQRLNTRCQARSGQWPSKEAVTSATENVQTTWVKMFSGEVCPFNLYALHEGYSG